jgi:uncharacterized membrane protein YhhN
MLAHQGRIGLDSPHLYFVWNPDRHFMSLLWTIVCIYPLGIFLLFLLLHSITPLSIPSLIYVTSMLIALLVYRAGAISRPS